MIILTNFLRVNDISKSSLKDRWSHTLMTLTFMFLNSFFIYEDGGGGGGGGGKCAYKEKFGKIANQNWTVEAGLEKICVFWLVLYKFKLEIHNFCVLRIEWSKVHKLNGHDRQNPNYTI